MAKLHGIVEQWKHNCSSCRGKQFHLLSGKGRKSPFGSLIFNFDYFDSEERVPALRRSLHWSMKCLLVSEEEHCTELNKIRRQLILGVGTG